MGTRRLLLPIATAALAAVLAIAQVAGARPSDRPILAVNDNGVWQDVDRTKALEALLIAAVRPRVADALTGRYGYRIDFWQEQVVSVQQLKAHPETLRAIIEVHTYAGAHNPVGTDRIEFGLTPSSFTLDHVEHVSPPRTP